MVGERLLQGDGRRAKGRRDPWALFLDFDGTLVEIADRPNGVVVDPALPQLLAELRRSLSGAVALISGRPIAGLDDLLAPERLDMAGLHGLEWRCGGQHAMTSRRPYDLLRPLVHLLQVAAADWPGVIVEDKGATVALHFRLAPFREPQIRELAETTILRLGPEFRLQSGKAVHEILPREADKGRAVARLLTMPPFVGRRPVFAGDDAADESAITAVVALGGIAIRIGTEGRSAAKVRIPDPMAFRRLLGDWVRTGTLPRDLQDW